MFFTWLRFYRPLFLISLLGVLGALAMSGLLTKESNIRFAKISYAVLSPVMHFIYYEFLRPSEYFYYRNLRWSRRELWIMSLFISLLLLVC